MEKVAILVETRNGRIKPSNLGVITAAHGAAHELYAFLIGGSTADPKAALGAYGVHTIIEISSKDGSLPWNPVTWTKAVVAAMQHFDIHTLLGLTSAQGKELLPRIAAQLDAPLVMDCIAVNLTDHTAEKPLYSGKTVATVKTRGSHHIYGIRPNAIEPQTRSTATELISFTAEDDPPVLTVREIKQSSAGGIDLTEADVIISGGRGMKNAENFRILKACAQTIGAAVGASRVAVDAGWVPHAMQVGQTGATVCPKVYIACGISGAVQHFAGMQTSGLIIAINTDPDAAITKRCDYFVVADLFDVMPRLASKLKGVD